MCLAIPGKVTEIGEDNFVIDYGSEKREVVTNLVENLRVGEYVIVSNKIIVARVEEEKAKKFLEMVKNG